MDTIPAIEDASPVQLPSPAEERGESTQMSIRDQIESARIAQQMFHQSEIQKFEGVIQALVSEMREMQQEDEGSEIRIQQWERQRDTACLAMQHLNHVNQEMKSDFESAMTRINEQSQAQRHHDYIVAKEMVQRLHQERNETTVNLVNLEEKTQGDGAIMAREYEMLSSELHVQARESLRLRATAASCEHALMTIREHLQLVRNEEVMAAGEVVKIRNAGLQEHQHLRDRLGAGLQEQQHLRNRLDEEEEFRSMAVQRMQQAEDQLRQVENCARRTLPTMHGELNELRRALKLQEDMQARTRSVLEAARHAPQGLRQPSSSMPISSRTTESGWEYLSRDRVQAFPVGSEIRSPEIHTPSHRSPVNREVFDFAGNAQPTAPLVMEGPAPEHVVPRADGQAPERPAQRAMPDDQAPERLAQRAASSSSSPEKSITTSEDARAVRDRQLRDLLTTLGIKEILTSSSSSATKGVSYDGNPSSGFAVAHVVVGQTKPIMLPRNIGDSNHASQLMRLEQKVEEMRIEMQKAQKAEQRLRIDRDEWRLIAENLQAPGDDDAEGEEDDNHDEDIFMMCMMEVLIPNLMMMIQGMVLQDGTEGVLVMIHPTEMIRMEVMIQSTPRLRFRVVKQTKLWFLLFPR